MEQKTLGERCRQYRYSHCITQEKLAQLVGVHTNTIIHAEQGKPLHWMTEAKIKQFFGEV